MAVRNQTGYSSIIEQLHIGISLANIKKALHDIQSGWARRELWSTLGMHDVRQRYRRSTLGPFWITISLAVMVFALGLLYGQIFGQDLREYLPFIAVGFVIWNLISTLILKGCETFISAEGMIRQLNAPLSIYAYRQVWSAIISFAHNIWIFFAVGLWYGLEPSLSMLWAVPALLVILFNGFWVSILLGLLSARFRDIPLIVASIVQVVFFITPVIWRPEMLPGRALLLVLNPLYHMVEIIRAPLLGSTPSIENWLAVILISVLGSALTLVFYSAYRWRIAYWI
jgi:ABC-2 type transport system permease protein/lipopolysaccharide transport system permease protein